MKVLYFAHCSNLYGANKSLLELILNLKKRYGIKPIVITPNYGELNKRLEELGIEQYVYRYYWWMDFKSNNIVKRFIKRIRNGIYNRMALIKIKIKFKNQEITIVHSNSSTIDIGAKLSKMLKVKHVWHVREFGEEDYNLIYFKGIKNSCKYIYRNTDAVIFISKALQDKYQKYFISNDKLKLIYNGISKDDYYINICDKDFESEFKVVFAGLISKEKNQFELLRALDILVNIKNIKDIKVVFLGNGDKNYISEMKKFIWEKGIEDNVQFEGKVDNIKKYIKECEVGVISSYNEAFGRVTIEYMLGGLAVIASNTGANKEIITDKVNGLIYSIGNINDLAHKIELLYKDREMLKKLSYSGQQQALNNFISDINCENIFNCYESLI